MKTSASSMVCKITYIYGSQRKQQKIFPILYNIITISEYLEAKFDYTSFMLFSLLGLYQFTREISRPYIEK